MDIDLLSSAEVGQIRGKTGPISGFRFECFSVDVDLPSASCFPSPMGSRGESDEQPVILCVTADRSKRAQVARLMSGQGVVLMFPDLQTVRAVLFEDPSTSATQETGAAALGRLVIDQQRQQASWAGRILPLTRLERDVLAALADPPLRVWTYQQLYERVWAADYLDDAVAVRSTVKRLRAKLREAKATIAVEAARGVGYSLVDTTSHGRH